MCASKRLESSFEANADELPESRDKNFVTSPDLSIHIQESTHAYKEGINWTSAETLPQGNLMATSDGNKKFIYGIIVPCTDRPP